MAKRDSEVPIDLSTGKVYHLACAAADLADDILLVGDPGRVPVVAESFDEGSITFANQHREINVMTGTYKGRPITVLSTGMGTDNCEIVLNEIHILKEYNVTTQQWKAESDRPSKVNIIRIGTCGSPRPELPVGALAVTRHCIGLDNTCQWYKKGDNDDDGKLMVDDNTEVMRTAIDSQCPQLAQIGYYTSKAHPSVTEALCKCANGSVFTGTTATCSGFYANQGRLVGRLARHCRVPDVVEQLSLLRHPGGGENEEEECSVVNIEMETSAICYLCNLLGYRGGAVCAVIATRYKDQRAFATPDESKEAISRAIQTALDALLLL